MAVRNSPSAGKVLQFIKIQIQIFSPKPSSVLDWSLCKVDSGPRAACLTALFQKYCTDTVRLDSLVASDLRKFQNSTFLCYVGNKTKRRFCLHTFITFIISFECSNKHFFCLLDRFSEKFISVLQYSQNNNSINRCHSEQSVDHMAMFMHESILGIWCRIVCFSRKNNDCKNEKLYKSYVIHHFLSGLHLHYKCTI